SSHSRFIYTLPLFSYSALLPLFFLFFLLLIPPPPISTLFPYTTLFRSLLGSNEMRKLLSELTDRFTHVIIDSPPAISFTDASVRSEEHTSELQSRGHLVCRLLLEKKKKKKKIII